MSAAVTSPGPSLVISSSIGSSRSSLNFRPFTLRMMSTTSSLTPGIVENSWLTPSMRTFVTAAPGSPESITRRKELPKVCPKPRGSGSATKIPRRSSSSSTLKRGGAISNIVKVPPARTMVYLLPAVKLDDELLFDGSVYLFPARGVEDPAREVLVVSFEPRRDGDYLLDGDLDRVKVPALLLDGDHIVRPQDGRRDVVLAPVQEEVPVGDELARLRPARREAHPVDDVVHPELHEPEQVLAADPRQPGSLVVGPPKLLLGDPVVPPGFLLLEEPHAVFRLSLPTAAVFPRRIGLLLERVLTHGREHHPRPPVSPAPRTCVTRHCSR